VNPTAVGNTPRYSTLRLVRQGAVASSAVSWPAKGRQASAPIAQPNVVTWSGEACRSAVFWLTALAA
jgi:hypothetical protein